jgi:hypothetical protein
MAGMITAGGASTRTQRGLRLLRRIGALIEHCITRIGTGFARWSL